MFNKHCAELDPPFCQALEQGAADVNIGGLQQVVLMSLPGAVAQRDVRELQRNRWKMPEQRNIQVADLQGAADPVVYFLTGFFQQGIFFKLDIYGQRHPE
jgi:hypothetical protein